MKKILGVIALLSLVGLGCIKKKDFSFKNLKVDNWQPDWALPILSSNLTLKNIIQPNTFLSEDAEGVYSLHYSGDIFQRNAADYIFIPNQNFNTPAITLTIPVTNVSFTGTINDSSTNHFTYSDTSGAQLAHMHVKSGSVTMNLVSTFKQNINATMIFPAVLKNGVPLQITATITYPSTTVSVNVDLSGYDFDLTNGNITKNYLNYKMRFTLTGTGQTLLPSNNLSANITMTDIKYSFLDGFLGRYDIPIPADTINVAVFDNTINAQIFVNNPKINLSFRNSFGLDVAAKFDQLYGITASGITTPNYITSPINVVGSSVPGQTKISTYTMDSASTAGSVQNLFNPAPNHVIYDGRIRINPGGAGLTYNFLTDSSTIALTADAELPAWFKIVTFTLQDTSKLVLPEDSSILQTAEFKLLMDNSLPLYGRVQLYFADENYKFIDSLVPTASDIIGEAPVDAAGKVNGRKKAETKFTMTHDEYNAMAPRVRYAIIRGQLKSSGTGSVKIQSSNNMIVKLAFRFKLNVASTDL